MSFILKLKHWQVFILIMIAGICTNSTVENNPDLDRILFFIGSLFFLLWPLILGHELYLHVPKKISLRYTLFIVNGFIWVAADVILIFVFDGSFESNNGLVVLAGFYLMYALFQYMSFPAKTLKTIENDKIARFGDYLADFLLFVFSPIGIWFLQPRINKIAERSPDVDINSSAPIDRPPYNV